MLTIHIDAWLLFVNAFVIFGWNYATQFTTTGSERYGNFQITDGAIFHKLHYYFVIGIERFIGKKSSRFIAQPLFGCVVCMASVWGTLFYCLFIPDKSIVSWLVWVVALAGINRLLKNFA